MAEYDAPQVTELGKLEDLTLSQITKTGGSGDVIFIGNEAIPVPGSSVVSVSG